MLDLGPVVRRREVMPWTAPIILVTQESSLKLSLDVAPAAIIDPKGKAPLLHEPNVK